MRYFQLNTVTYGTACAPYLSTKCLQHLAQVAPASQQPEGVQQHSLNERSCGLMARHF